jgi:hypothetical protein
VNPQDSALYEIKRQSFLMGFIVAPQHFSDALAFAYYNRLAPVFHEQIERELYGVDPFEQVYAVKADFINEVLHYVDEQDLAGNHADLGFYKLEDRFGGYKANRIELKWALEYARIDGRFSAKVWAAIEADAPVEANSLRSNFAPQDVSFD